MSNRCIGSDSICQGILVWESVNCSACSVLLRVFGDAIIAIVQATSLSLLKMCN